MIGYYVHHHGSGHRTRAVEVARHLDAVVGFGSLPVPDGWPGEWVQLPADDDGAIHDPTAGGVLHWAPLGHRGHAHRLGALAQRLATDVRAMVVDTSAEITLLSRLMGVPTAVVALRGDRSDRPHRAAFDAATTILAPWTASTAEPGWPAGWIARTEHVGAISRFDDRTPQPRPARTGDGGTVLLVWGAGGTDVTGDDVAAAERATPGWRWVVRSPEQPSPDLWRDLQSADVVVCHAGNNVLAEVAAARAPAVVVAQDRPFDEHLATVDALRRAGCCVALSSWPPVEDWPALLERAVTGGGRRWSAWSHGDGAVRAADAVSRLTAVAR